MNLEKITIGMFLAIVLLLVGVILGATTMSYKTDSDTIRNLKGYSKTDCATIHKAELYRVYNEVCNE